MTAQVLAIAASVLLSMFILFDGLKTRSPQGWLRPALEALGFLVVSLSLAISLVTPERLPDPVTIAVRSWGFFVCAGMCAGLLLQQHLARRDGLLVEPVFNIWIYGALAALAGGRMLHVAVNWHDYGAQPLSALAFWDGGFVFMGSVVAYAAVAVAYVRFHGLEARYLDFLVLGIALAQGLGRVGCFLAGCCFGRPTNLPWGVRYEEGSIAYYALGEAKEIASGAMHTPSLHPVQLYESLGCMVIAAALLFLLLRRRPQAGTVLCAYFVAYPAIRFVLELLRYDPDRQYVFRIPAETPFLLSTSQAVALVLASAALLRLRKIGFRKLASR